MPIKKRLMAKVNITKAVVNIIGVTPSEATPLTYSLQSKKFLYYVVIIIIIILTSFLIAYLEWAVVHLLRIKKILTS